MGYGFNDRNFSNMEKVFSEEHKYGRKGDKQQSKYLQSKNGNRKSNNQMMKLRIELAKK